MNNSYILIKPRLPFLLSSRSPRFSFPRFISSSPSPYQCLLNVRSLLFHPPFIGGCKLFISVALTPIASLLSYVTASRVFALFDR